MSSTTNILIDTGITDMFVSVQGQTSAPQNAAVQATFLGSTFSYPAPVPSGQTATYTPGTPLGMHWVKPKPDANFVNTGTAPLAVNDIYFNATKDIVALCASQNAP